MKSEIGIESEVSHTQYLAHIAGVIAGAIRIGFNPAFSIIGVSIAPGIMYQEYTLRSLSHSFRTLFTISSAALLMQ